MSKNFVLLMISILSSFLSAFGIDKEKDIEVTTQIEMRLNAFGVEVNNFPSINVYINLETDSSFCEKTFYDPKYKSDNYSLSKTELTQIKNLLQIALIQKLRQSYTINRQDQPTSTTKIITNKTIYTIEDYGLMGENPLPKLYEITYKL